eukprot:CAMPEP_0202074826 /NCGR_PEP_ID=MMETSP0964-20121228/3850_1 /ASSEMBLY_ACC=CAM_ASM_000500 /TAXON_ID=4773 /ORGANISM="Schizochytrium aggregatum, Strain ATCC28209" /LENGTH=437 /DNA_ID=CAMNT_0048641997 /DNA_START=23 /DNA_END=1337 /DNA_ORIENTATION=+
MVAALQNPSTFHIALSNLVEAIEHKDLTGVSVPENLFLLRDEAWDADAARVILEHIRAKDVPALSPGQLVECARCIVYLLGPNDDAHQTRANHLLRWGLTHLMAALFDATHDLPSQRWGCILVWRVACSEDTKRSLVDNGPVEGVVAAIKSHPRVATIQRNGCRALSEVARFSRFAIKISRQGAGEALVDAMRNMPEDEDVLRFACNGISHLAYGKVINSSLINLGAVDAIVDMMNRFPTKAPLQRAGCGALATILSASPVEFQAVFVDKGVDDAVLAALKAHIKTQEVVKPALRVIHHLSVDPGIFFANPSFARVQRSLVAKKIKPLARQARVLHQQPEVLRIVREILAFEQEPDVKPSRPAHASGPNVLTLRWTNMASGPPKLPSQAESPCGRLQLKCAVPPQSSSSRANPLGRGPVHRRVAHAHDGAARPRSCR